MTYTVTLSVEANEDLETAYEWLVERTPLHGPAWYNGLVDAVLSLENYPERCPLAPENKDSSEITRQLLYGKRQHAYRIVFTIRDKVVWVVAIPHGAMDSRR